MLVPARGSHHPRRSVRIWHVPTRIRRAVPSDEKSSNVLNRSFSAKRLRSGSTGVHRCSQRRNSRVHAGFIRAANSPRSGRIVARRYQLVRGPELSASRTARPAAPRPPCQKGDDPARCNIVDNDRRRNPPRQHQPPTPFPAVALPHAHHLRGPGSPRPRSACASRSCGTLAPAGGVVGRRSYLTNGIASGGNHAEWALAASQMPVAGDVPVARGMHAARATRSAAEGHARTCRWSCSDAATPGQGTRRTDFPSSKTRSPSDGFRC
jgi:hypothetical protein